MRIFVMIIAFCLLAGSVFAWFHTDRIPADAYNIRKILCPFAAVTVLGAAAVRYGQALDPDQVFQTAVLKFCASLPSVLFAFRGFMRLKTDFSRMITAALVMCMLADIAININMAAGAVLFGIAHLLFSAAFIREKKPSKNQVLLWLGLSLLIGVTVYFFREKAGSTAAAAGGAVYLSIMISTVVFSWQTDRLTFAAACVFALSDLMLIFNAAVNAGVLMRTAALLVYYISLLIFGCSLWKRSI